MAVNIKALQQRSPQSDALFRYDEIGRLLNNNSAANADDAIHWVQQVCVQLTIPGLRTYGVTEKNLSVLIEKGQAASSMKGNPIVLTPEELGKILMRAL